MIKMIHITDKFITEIIKISDWRNPAVKSQGEIEYTVLYDDSESYMMKKILKNETDFTIDIDKDLYFYRFLPSSFNSCNYIIFRMSISN